MRIGQHTHELETQVENMVHAGTTAPSAFDELMASYDQALVLFEQLVKPAAAPEAAGADVDSDVEETQAGVPAPASSTVAARPPGSTSSVTTAPRAAPSSASVMSCAPRAEMA